MNPRSETLGYSNLLPVNNSFSNQSAASISALSDLHPRVETASGVHMSSTGNEVRHDFVAQTLHLGDSVLLGVFISQNLVFYFLDLQSRFVLSLLEFLDVAFKHLLLLNGQNLSPNEKGLTPQVAFNSVVRSI